MVTDNKAIKTCSVKLKKNLLYLNSEHQVKPFDAGAMKILTMTQNQQKPSNRTKGLICFKTILTSVSKELSLSI